MLRQMGYTRVRRGSIRTELGRPIEIDLRGAQISRDSGFVLLREIDEPFYLSDPVRTILSPPGPGLMASTLRFKEPGCKTTLSLRGLETSIMLIISTLMALLVRGHSFQTGGLFRGS
jgi:hypothetical protein